MLPAVLRYNETANAERQALVAEAFGRAGEPAWQVVDEFIAGLGLPRSLAAVGVTPDRFETVAKAAMLDHYLHTNPRPIHGVEDVMRILQMAAWGRVNGPTPRGPTHRAPESNLTLFRRS